MHHYQTTTTLSPDQLWPVLANVNGWAAIDDNIQEIHLDGEARPGATFTLQPRGGPRLRFRIGDFQPPHRYSDICKLFLAEMETTHSFLTAPNGTTIDIHIQIRGPLAWLWGRLVGQRHASGLPAQTAKFLTAAQAGSALSPTMRQP